MQNVRPLVQHASVCFVLRQGRGEELLSCGDVESNPGPRHGRSSGSIIHIVDRELQHQGLLDLMDFEQIPPPDAGPASNRPSRAITESAWWQAYCLCGWASPFRDPTVALQHLGTCRMARSIRRNRQLEREHADTKGTRAALSVGPLNNGSLAEEHNEGRGASLLSCGDIEANPGPGDPADPPGPTPGVADGMQLDAEGMQMLMALAATKPTAPAPDPAQPTDHMGLTAPPGRWRDSPGAAHDTPATDRGQAEACPRGCAGRLSARAPTGGQRPAGVGQ